MLPSDRSGRGGPGLNAGPRLHSKIAPPLLSSCRCPQCTAGRRAAGGPARDADRRGPAPRRPGEGSPAARASEGRASEGRESEARRGGVCVLTHTPPQLRRERVLTALCVQGALASPVGPSTLVGPGAHRPGPEPDSRFDQAGCSAGLARPSHARGP